MMDTRLITAAQDAKAAAAALDDGHLSAAKAAIDDARTALWELLNEGPNLSPIDRRDIKVNYEVLERRAAMKEYESKMLAARSLDAVYGSLTRIADRWTT